MKKTRSKDTVSRQQTVGIGGSALLPAWVAERPTLAVAFLDVTVIELGRFAPKRAGPIYGVLNPDRFGLVPAAFELRKAADCEAFLTGLASGFSWRELYAKPSKLSGWRFEEAYEEKAARGDYSNKGMWCFLHTARGWREVDSYEDIEPEIDESMGTFATVTDEPFQRPGSVAFMAKGYSPVEVRLAPSDPFARISSVPYLTLARELSRRLGANIVKRTAVERAGIRRTHACPLELLFPRGAMKRKR